MKRTVALLDKFIRLSKGETVPSSSLRGDWIDQMLADEILVVSTKGSRKSYRACDECSFRNYLSVRYDIRDLEAHRALLMNAETDRAEQVKVAGDSKVRRRRTFQGFLVNCYVPIAAELNGQPVTLLPAEGSFVFISDYRTFSVSADVVVVGVENADNFRYICQQKWLFEACVSVDSPILFVSRYPQEQSHDFMKWLQNRQNRYVHFGDLDLAGVHIFLTEYYCHLGERATFLVPDDYEHRIALGSAERYADQYSKFGKMEVTDSRLSALVACIHRYHRGYDQEGYIGEE